MVFGLAFSLPLPESLVLVGVPKSLSWSELPRMAWSAARADGTRRIRSARATRNAIRIGGSP